MKQALRFGNTGQNEFVKVLNQRVSDYFKSNNISKYANGAMVFKTIFYLSLQIGAYVLLFIGGFSTPVTFLLWALLGFGLAMTAMNIGHDAIHGSYSSNKWVNSLLSHTFNFNGASAYMWKKMHNVAHHTYTNIEGYDEDIESLPIIRMSPSKPLKPVHRYQHLFAFWFYGLATISWTLIKDYVKFFKNEVGNFKNEPHPKREYFFLFFYKAIHYTIFIGIPFMFFEGTWGQILLGWLLMHYVAGVTIAIIFMLAHVVEETHFPVPKEDGTLENTWAVHQLYTTANFSGQSWLASFISGGLNTQVEHHLFPNICHIHYRHLSPIVEKTAAEYGIPYFNASTPHAIASHFRFLKEMGRQENYQPITAVMDKVKQKAKAVKKKSDLQVA